MGLIVSVLVYTELNLSIAPSYVTYVTRLGVNLAASPDRLIASMA